MLAGIEIIGQSGRREKFGHGERLQAHWQLRQRDISQILGDIARHGLTQRFVVEHAAGDQRSFDTAVVRHTQQRSDL